MLEMSITVWRLTSGAPLAAMVAMAAVELKLVTDRSVARVPVVLGSANFAELAIGLRWGH